MGEESFGKFCLTKKTNAVVFFEAEGPFQVEGKNRGKRSTEF